MLAEALGEVSAALNSTLELDGVLACRGESRGKVAVKGKGEMEMFLVEGLR